MPRFPVAFGKRKSAANVNEDVSEARSFRVFERAEVGGPGAREQSVTSFDGQGESARLSAGKPVTTRRSLTQPNLLGEENMFNGLSLKNRGSGSSNTTKTVSTDTSSRHSAASTAPSSAAPPSDPGHQHDEARTAVKKPYADIPVPPIPKSSSGFLNRAGRTFSFGSTKKSLPPMPTENSEAPPVPAHDYSSSNSRQRALTTSTTSTATPPKINSGDFSNLDMGGDFGKMFSGLDKRASVVTVRDDANRGTAPRSLTGHRLAHPSPLKSENIPVTKPLPSSPYSFNSDQENEGLLGAGASSPLSDSTPDAHIKPPQVPRHSSPMTKHSNRPLEVIEDDNCLLLKESLAASKLLGTSSGNQNGGRHRRNDVQNATSFEPGWRDLDTNSSLPSGKDEDNLFDNTLASSARVVNQYVARAPSPPRNKVMTPAQFEKFRQEKERTAAAKDTGQAMESKDDDDDEDNYEDDDDDLEKSKQAAKQRRKQEAHMTVYRQQMMKVTGESANFLPRSSMVPVTGPNMNMRSQTPGVGLSDESDEDEEVPLAILAAHGFPNKNRAPARLSSYGSNSNIRASVISTTQPQKTGGETPTSGSANASRASHLPAFARNLPQDPFVGAGLVRNSTRDSLAMGGGSPAPMPTGAQPPLPAGGLVGMIASEERSRALRRGSPQVDQSKFMGNGGHDSMAGIPAQTMYGMGGSPSMPHLGLMGGMAMPQMMPPQMLTPGDQAQIQMSQQMQQFMQMQMQQMQMMQQMIAGNQGGGSIVGGHPAQHMATNSMGDLSSRHSFVGDQGMGMGVRGSIGGAMVPPRLDGSMRTMSMVQPSSASWVQPSGGFVPSANIQGTGYAPSIAPSERSNIGLPGRYRPVSQMPATDATPRLSTMSGAITDWDASAVKPKAQAKSGNSSDDDDDESGWEAMKAKREKRKSIWKSKKSFSKELNALIS